MFKSYPKQNNVDQCMCKTEFCLATIANSVVFTRVDEALEQRKQLEKTKIWIILEDLKQCSKTQNLAKGRRIHAEAKTNGLLTCIYVSNSLINMYAKCRCMLEARQVFDSIKRPNVASWTSLVQGYAENGEGCTALDMFTTMRTLGSVPNYITFVAALKACISLSKRECFERGKQIHLEVGKHMNSYVQNTLIDVYAKCGRINEAQRVFDGIQKKDVISWTSLILGYVENGKASTALDFFSRMRSQGCVPDSVTYLAAFKACACLALEKDGSSLRLGKQLHSEMGSLSNLCVQNTLIDMYAKCGSLPDARMVFDGLKDPNVVSWSALIQGYADNGESVMALELFKEMKRQECSPNHVTFSAALKACGSLGALASGKKIHLEIGRKIELNAILLTSLVDFYAKCGSLFEAQTIFDLHPRSRDLTTWTALLAGYSRLGDNKAVFELFDTMRDSGVEPDSVTFLCILTCCNHSGLVDKAVDFFDGISTKYQVVPIVEHYHCMVDILTRSNKLDDAVALLRGMPFRANTVTWTTILGACRKWKNVGIGRLAFKSLLSLDCAAAYVLMAQIYESKGMHEEGNILLNMSKFRHCKIPGKTYWTDEMDEVHSFVV